MGKSKLKINEPLYVNVVDLKNGQWALVWDDEYLCSTSHQRALELRDEFIYKITHSEGTPIPWSEVSVKTVLVTRLLFPEKNNRYDNP